jgi:hypothetical protein
MAAAQRLGDHGACGGVTFLYLFVAALGILLFFTATLFKLANFLAWIIAEHRRRRRSKRRGGPTILDFTAGRVLLPGDEGYEQALRRGERTRRKQAATVEGLPPEAVQEWIL